VLVEQIVQRQPAQGNNEVLSTFFFSVMFVVFLPEFANGWVGFSGKSSYWDFKRAGSIKLLCQNGAFCIPPKNLNFKISLFRNATFSI
jgi:hypothetical protein